MMEPIIHRLFGVPVYATKLNREFSAEEMEEINKHQNKSVRMFLTIAAQIIIS